MTPSGDVVPVSTGPNEPTYSYDETECEEQQLPDQLLFTRSANQVGIMSARDENECEDETENRSSDDHGGYPSQGASSAS